MLNIPICKLAVTIFEGYKEIPKDTEAYDCWIKVGLNESQIFYGGMKENWWGPAGKTGLCGPDTEIFYDTGKEPCGHNCSPLCDCGRFTVLSQKNVDTGMSLERILAVYNYVSSNYETDLFEPIINTIEKMTNIVGNFLLDIIKVNILNSPINI